MSIPILFGSGLTARAIRQGISRIGEHQPELSEHLNHAIRTGTYCVYFPDPRIRTTWTI